MPSSVFAVGSLYKHQTGSVGGTSLEGTPFGRYRLVELRGRGGMGEVWRAYDTRTDREVAIKVLPAHFADDQMFLQRFRREAHAAARLHNPHVIPIHDYGEIDGRLYVDMRLIEGRDLQTVLVEGPLEPARAARIIEQVAKALHAAHKVGLVHRDVKPSNVLLDEDDYAYLIDFGIARALDETRLTGTGNAIGTFQYMAPERLSDKADDDARADIYALACVLYECLTGEPPFAGNGMAGLVAAHLNAPPPQPSATHPRVPARFDAVIATGMAKDPNQRYATTVELATAAHDAVTAPIPIAPPASPPPSSPPNRPAAVPFPPTPPPRSPIPRPADETVRASALAHASTAARRWQTGVCATLLILAACFGGAAIVLVFKQYGRPIIEQRVEYDAFLWSGAAQVNIGDDRIVRDVEFLFGLSWLTTAAAFLLLGLIFTRGQSRSSRLAPICAGAAAAVLSAVHFLRPIRAYQVQYWTSWRNVNSAYSGLWVLDFPYFLVLLVTCIGLVVFATALRKRFGNSSVWPIGLSGLAGLGLSLTYLYGFIGAGYTPLYHDRLASEAKIPFIAMAIWLVSLLVLAVTLAVQAARKPQVSNSSGTLS